MKMRLFSLSQKFLLAITLPVAMMHGPAQAADSRPVSQLRITEVTGVSHPFETLHCARQPVKVRFIGPLAEVIVNNESRTLVQAMSASGARYVAPGDDTTTFWSKGQLATITWSGQTLPLCAPSGAIVTPYRASGNEPFWSVTYDGWQATLRRPGEPDQTRDAQITETSDKGQTLTAGEGPDSWRLATTDGLCIDTMSGMSYPQQATLHYQSQSLQGCGGNPERLLQGTSWEITDIGDHENRNHHSNTDKPTGSNAIAAHLRFSADNTITGYTDCNRFFGQYTLTGESLTLGNMGSTRMACPDELMVREHQLLKMLEAVNRFSFEDASAQRLLLHTSQGDIRAKAQINRLE